MSFWTYILINHSGRFYIGSTDDVVRRVKEHNDFHRGKTTFTHKNGPWELVWSEPHSTRADAMKRDKEIKAKKSSRWIRENLLNGRVPIDRD